MVTVVPAPGSDDTVNLPPTLRARSRIDASPSRR